MSAPIIPGAEPESIDGRPHGALVLHGFTGNPNSMRGVAHALAGAGFAVELPLLPGHGTSVADMLETGWADWSAAAEEALDKLEARVEGKVVVVGLSMGGALTLWLATRHPELAGIACINAIVTAPEGMEEGVKAMLDSGTELMDGVGSDIAEPGVVESAYPETPLRPLLTLLDAETDTRPKLPDVTCPVLVITSRQDHVVAPENSDVLADEVGGPVERVWLDRSFHVATLDYEKDVVNDRVVEFCRRVVS